MNNPVRLGAAAVAALMLSSCAHRPAPVQPAPLYGGPVYGPAPVYSQPPVYSPSRRGSPPPVVYPASRVQHGRVASIEVVSARRSSGGGALVGGLVGALVGRQFGNSSHGRTNGTIVGAVGGAIIGNEIEKDQLAGREHVRVSIQLDHGGTVQFHYASIADLRVGDRVRIDGNQVYRL